MMDHKGLLDPKVNGMEHECINQSDKESSDEISNQDDDNVAQRHKETPVS